MVTKNDKKRNIAVRSENIIEARFSLTSKQNNILDMVFSQIQNDDVYQYEISVDKYKHLYKIDTSNLYRDLRKAAKDIQGKGFYIVDKVKNEEIFYVWFSKIHYIPNEGRIKVNIDRDLKKLLYEVKKKIYYDIEYTLNFSSSYSQRMYYYLKSFEDTGWRKDNIEDLQKKLECPKTYQNYSNFKKYVLDVCKAEINATCDIMFDYEVEKTGKKVSHVYFAVNKKNDINNPVMNELAITDSNDDIDEIFIKNTIQEPILNDDIAKIINATNTGFEEQKNNKELNKDQVTTDIRTYFNFNYLSAKKYFHEKLKGEGVFIAILLSALKGNWHLQSKYKKKSVKSESNNTKPNQQTKKEKQMTFNDYPQREYDMDELERKLLGWDDDNAV